MKTEGTQYCETCFTHFINLKHAKIFCVDFSRSLERESRDEEQPSALLVDPLRSGHRSRYPNRPSQ